MTDISSGLIPVGARGSDNGTPYNDGSADGSTSHQSALFAYSGNDHTSVFPVDASRGEAIVLTAINFPTGTEAHVEIVTGKGGGDVFTPMTFNNKPVTLSDTTTNIVIPYSGRYRLVFVDEWPEDARIMALRQMGVQDALQALLPQFDFQVAAEVPFSPQGLAGLTATDVQGAIAELAALIAALPPPAAQNSNTALVLTAANQLVLSQLFGADVTVDLSGLIPAPTPATAVTANTDAATGVISLLVDGVPLVSWREGADYSISATGAVVIDPAGAFAPFIVAQDAGQLPAQPVAGMPAGATDTQAVLDYIAANAGASVQFVDNGNNTFTITIDGTPTTFNASDVLAIVHPTAYTTQLTQGGVAIGSWDTHDVVMVDNNDGTVSLTVDGATEVLASGPITIPPGGSVVLFSDNGDGTYTITINGAATLIDTRANSNPFDNTNFIATEHNGQPVDDVQIALDALSAVVSALIGGDDLITLNNPTLYIRQATGSDANDGSSAAQAFKTFNGMLTYVQGAFIIGDVTVDAHCTTNGPQSLDPSDFKGAASVYIHGDLADDSKLVFNWGVSSGGFSDGIRVADGLVITLAGMTVAGQGNSNYARGLVANKNAIVTLDSNVRFTGTATATCSLIEAGSSAQIITPRSTNGQPRCKINLDLTAGQTIAAYLKTTGGGSIHLDDARTTLQRDITVSDVVACYDGGTVSFTAGPSASARYETDFVGPGNFIGAMYKLLGTGSHIREIRVTSLTYGQEQTYFRTSTANKYDGIGTYTVFDGSNYRYGNSGTYH